METFMAAFSPLPATSPMTTSSPPSGGLHVEEVAAHLVGRVVDRVHLEAGSFELFSWGIISSCTLRAAASSLEARSWSRCMRRKRTKMMRR
jgi:hypothetical protein